MGRRTVLLITALVVAALGTTGVFLYVNGVDKRAEAEYQVVEALVATVPIAAGSTAQSAQDVGGLELRPFLRKSLAGLPALSDISTISDKVALSPIAAGEAILASQFVDPGQSNSLPIPEGKLAVSIQLGDPNRVAGFVGPGSRVAIFLTTADVSGTNSGQDSTRPLLPDIEVIAAGATTLVTTTSGSGQTEELPRAILTLAADQQEAQKIVFASQHGEIYFALLSKDSRVTKSDSGTNAENLFD